MKGSDFQRARARAYRLLARRARSRHELTQRLQQAGFSPPVIEQVLAYLQEHGLVDDRAFAEQWVRWRLQEHVMGTLGLRYELRKKGVPEEIIDQALAGLDEERQFQDALTLARHRRAIKGAGYSRLKIAAFLQRRGYSYELISRVCHCLENGEQG